MDRRAFLGQATLPLVAFAGVVVGWPLLAFFFGYGRRPPARHYTPVPGLDRVPVNEPVRLEFADIQSDAYLSENVTRDVWVVRHANGEMRVFSPICPHLGCRYQWEPGRSDFVCPCHGSVFTMDGKVVAGPSPRPLDALPYRVQGGRLEVEWERFKVGLAEKVPV